LAIVTGESSGIGYYLARQCIKHGFDLLIAADDPKINNVAKELCASGASVDAVETDLATLLGVDEAMGNVFSMLSNAALAYYTVFSLARLVLVLLAIVRQSE
jgi:NAD(P)-dependent dehydrogenase (short-subunit alcohol dehydrogenase family)